MCFGAKNHVRLSHRLFILFCGNKRGEIRRLKINIGLKKMKLLIQLFIKKMPQKK
jgi:hypothetical protein